jgi:agmatinase
MVTWMHFLEKNMGFACQYNSESRYVIMGIPMDWTTTYMPGTRFAPASIREASCNIELYSLMTGRSIEHISYNDLGDLSLPFGNVPASLGRIERAVRGLREDYAGKTYFFVGGEHLVTLPIIKGLREEVDNLVVFDAHGDLRNDYLGEKLSHASVMRRIAEDTGVKIYIVGVRALSTEEEEYVGRSDGISIFSSIEAERRREEILSNVNISGNTYISIDMDAIDPAYAPGVSNPEALGLTPITLLSIVREVIRRSKRIVGLDVVEVNPLRDVNNVTSILAAKLIVEAVGMLDSLH